MFMFGIQCVRCNHEIIAPDKSEFVDDRSFVISGTARDVKRGSNPFRDFPQTENW